MTGRSAHRTAFTLIELSIVLVIIGLIVGGVLVGRDLISAAQVRAQVSQIEKYNQAVNTFRGKYNYLPGDIAEPDATRFGFVARGTLRGQGDGNAILETFTTGSAPLGSCGSGGEITMFWVDLSKMGLVDGGFNINTMTTAITATGPQIELYIPPAKIGSNNYVNVWSDSGINYFGLSQMYILAAMGIQANANIPVKTAYNIDKKVDDGLPQSGTVMARSIMWTGPVWPYNWSGNGAFGGINNGNGADPGTAAAASSITCYDNGNNTSNPMQYSLTQNNGNGTNCALSFKMQ